MTPTVGNGEGPATPCLVADSSVIVTLLIDSGEHGALAAARVRGRRLYAPHLLPFEVNNVLRRRRNAGLLSEGEARMAGDGLGLLPIELWPFEAIRGRLWSHGHNLSGYDAAYVALAEALGCPLVTFDARIGRAPGVNCAVELLS